MMLARLDNARDYQRLLDEANRNGVTFYPIDIVGLRVGGMMNRRADSLITLATATDGVAVINSNSFTPALNRINEDLASYYLLGYYTSNTKSDGTFRKIDVKVKRPGVNVRARRGYLALTAAERAALSNPPAAKPDPTSMRASARCASSTPNSRASGCESPPVTGGRSERREVRHQLPSSGWLENWMRKRRASRSGATVNPWRSPFWMRRGPRWPAAARRCRRLLVRSRSG